MIKAIFFDTAGVLLKEGFTVGIREYEERYSIPAGQLYKAAHDFQYWKDFTLGKISEKQYWEKVSENFPGKLNIKEARELIFKNFYAQKNVISCARELKSSNFIIGVVTNNPKEWFEYLFKKYGIMDIFTIKAVSSYIHIRKPDVKIFQYALQEAGVKGPEAIYIDDSPRKVQGAEALGMKIIIYDNFPDFKDQLDEILRVGI